MEFFDSIVLEYILISESVILIHVENIRSGESLNHSLYILTKIFIMLNTE